LVVMMVVAADFKDAEMTFLYRPAELV